jgi:hypothetical protein
LELLFLTYAVFFQVPGYLHGLLSNECEAVCAIALRWVAVAETWDHGRL